MARYATLQLQQPLKLATTPFISNAQQQNYHLFAPILEQECEVHLYENTAWLREQLPHLQELLPWSAWVKGLPLDVVLEENGEPIGLVLPLTEGQPLTNALLVLPLAARQLLAYQLLLKAAQIEEKIGRMLVLDSSQFFVAGKGQLLWQWNPKALPNTAGGTDYAQLLYTILPELPPLEPTTALEAAVDLLLQLPLAAAQQIVKKSHLGPAILMETRLPIPTLTPLDNKEVLEAMGEAAMDWPVLEPMVSSLEPAPLVKHLETGIWLFSSAVLVAVLSGLLVGVAWPALVAAYEQDFYALIGAWLVGGVLLVALCLIGGSYLLSKGTHGLVQQLQEHFTAAFYYQHPTLQRAEDSPTLHSDLLIYKEQQEQLQEQLEELLEEGHYLQAKIQQCQELMIHLRTAANHQLEQLYTSYQLAHRQIAQQHQQQLSALLEQGSREAVVQQLKAIEEGTHFLTLKKHYKEQMTLLKRRYELAQSTQQQEWQVYKSQVEQLEKEWKEWQFLQNIHWSKRGLMEQQAQAWTLKRYREALLER